MKEKINKIILAYSGGLDTSVILHWLKQEYACEVVAFTADLGQDFDPEEVKKRSNQIGASKIYIEDLKEEFVKDYVFPMFRANTVYEGEYLLGTSIARPLISKSLIDLARILGDSNQIYTITLDDSPNAVVDILDVTDESASKVDEHNRIKSRKLT